MGLLHQPAIGLHRRIEGIAMAYAGLLRKQADKAKQQMLDYSSWLI